MHGNFKKSTDLPRLDDQADGLSSMVWSFLFSHSRGGWLVEPRTKQPGKCVEVPNVPKQNSNKDHFCWFQRWNVLIDIHGYCMICLYLCIHTFLFTYSQYTCNSILCDQNHLGHLLCCYQKIIPSCCWDHGARLPFLSADRNRVVGHMQDFDCARLQISIYGATAGLPKQTQYTWSILKHRCTDERICI